MFWPEYLEALAPLLPNLPAVCFHGANNTLLSGIVGVAEAVSQTIDVKHGKIGQQSDYDYDIDKY